MIPDKDGDLLPRDNSLELAHQTETTPGRQMQWELTAPPAQADVGALAD